MKNLTARAEQLARTAHEGQNDKSGAPYILHPERVAQAAAAAAPEHLTDQAAAVGWLHDVVEDTGVTLKQLRAEGFPEAVVAGVDAMTKRRGEDAPGYFTRVRADELARIVKNADLDDNTDPERVSRLDRTTQIRLAAKYDRSRALLISGDPDGSVLIRIENSYSDGHESTLTKRIAAPAEPDDEEELDEWWNDAVFALTGDGHGEKHPGVDSSYSAEILDGPARLIGETYDWG